MSTTNEAAIVAEEINHDVVKRAAQNLIEHAEKFSIAELHKADMAGVVGLSLAYLDLAAQLEAANANAEELLSRLDTVTASHCEMLRELQAERQRVDKLATLLRAAASLLQKDEESTVLRELTTIMKART